MYDNGFFSMLFFIINHYLYAKANSINFRLDTSNWLYLYKKGWTDYFMPIDLIFNENNTEEKVYGHNKVIQDYSVREYKKIIPTIMKYNDGVKEYIQSIYDKLNLHKGEYSSIYIRRGCKLSYESKFHESYKYLELLLEKDPSCSKIFLQTDDYNSYIDIISYISEKNLDIEVLTLCESDMVGMSVSLDLKYMTTSIPKNTQYFSKIRHHVKMINQMNKDEIKDHTYSLLAEIDITCNSKICITDYQSNVARYIKLAHNNFENVFDIEGHTMNLDILSCPAYEKCCYEDVEKMRQS
jgi:hypothetical protein